MTMQCLKSLDHSMNSKSETYIHKMLYNTHPINRSCSSERLSSDLNFVSVTKKLKDGNCIEATTPRRFNIISTEDISESSKQNCAKRVAAIKEEWNTISDEISVSRSNDEKLNYLILIREDEYQIYPEVENIETNVSANVDSHDYNEPNDRYSSFQKDCKILSLPVEVIHTILEYCCDKTVLTFSLSCSQFWNFGTQRRIWLPKLQSIIWHLDKDHKNQILNRKSSCKEYSKWRDFYVPKHSQLLTWFKEELDDRSLHSISLCEELAIKYQEKAYERPLPIQLEDIEEHFKHAHECGPVPCISHKGFRNILQKIRMNEPNGNWISSQIEKMERRWPQVKFGSVADEYPQTSSFLNYYYFFRATSSFVKYYTLKRKLRAQRRPYSSRIKYNRKWNLKHLRCLSRARKLTLNKVDSSKNFSSKEDNTFISQDQAIWTSSPEDLISNCRVEALNSFSASEIHNQSSIVKLITNGLEKSWDSNIENSSFPNAACCIGEHNHKQLQPVDEIIHTILNSKLNCLDANYTESTIPQKKFKKTSTSQLFPQNYITYTDGTESSNSHPILFKKKDTKKIKTVHEFKKLNRSKRNKKNIFQKGASENSNSFAKIETDPSQDLTLNESCDTTHRKKRLVPLHPSAMQRSLDGDQRNWSQETHLKYPSNQKFKPCTKISSVNLSDSNVLSGSLQLDKSKTCNPKHLSLSTQNIVKEQLQVLIPEESQGKENIPPKKWNSHAQNHQLPSLSHPSRKGLISLHCQEIALPSISKGIIHQAGTTTYKQPLLHRSTHKYLRKKKMMHLHVDDSNSELMPLITCLPPIHLKQQMLR